MSLCMGAHYVIMSLSLCMGAEENLFYQCMRESVKPIFSWQVGLIFSLCKSMKNRGNCIKQMWKPLFTMTIHNP